MDIQWMDGLQTERFTRYMDSLAACLRHRDRPVRRPGAYALGT